MAFSHLSKESTILTLVRLEHDEESRDMVVHHVRPWNMVPEQTHSRCGGRDVIVQTDITCSSYCLVTNTQVTDGHYCRCQCQSSTRKLHTSNISDLS